MQKPFSEACERNKAPIFAVLERHMAVVETLLEVGSGTGQHAVFFGEAFPHVEWQTADLAPAHAGIRAWLEESGLANVKPPLALDVEMASWPVGDATLGAVYSANTAHIMSEAMVEAFIAGVGRVLVPGGLFFLYGPFNYGGEYTSESNARFDDWLAARDPRSAIRHFEWVEELAARAGMEILEDHEMPANNRLLVFRKGGG